MGHSNALWAAGFTLAALLTTTSLLLGRTSFSGELAIGAPNQPVRDLTSSFDLSLSGSEIYDQAIAVAVFLDDEDCTDVIETSFIDESRADFNEDGILEHYSATLRIGLWALTRTAGQLLRVVSTANAPARPVLASWSTRIGSHVEIYCDNALAAGQGLADFGVITRVYDVRAASFGWRVLHNGVDVTSQVGTSAPSVNGESADEQSPPHIDRRHADYGLDLSALTLAVGDMLDVAFSVTAVGGRVSTEAKPVRIVEAGGTLTPCHKLAIDTFVASMGISKSETPSTTTVANPSNFPSASASLKAALKACNESQSMGDNPKMYTTPSGLKIKIQLANVNKDSEVVARTTEAVDFVNALGGDGEGSKNGGTASAKNELDGGCALAAGGNRGNEVSPGKKNGGESNASSKSESTGSSLALGGAGGKPTPNTKAGGNGGKSTAANGQGGDNSTVKKQAGGTGLQGSGVNPGMYGTGGLSLSLKGRTTRSAPGSQVPNP